MKGVRELNLLDARGDGETLNSYYERDGITIYHGDALDILPCLNSDSVDLIVVDPPYGVNYRSNRGHDHKAMTGDDGSLNVPELLRHACRVLKRGRHAYVFGPIDLTDTPLAAQVELIWDKGIVGMGNLELPWSSSHEPVTFAVYEPSAANRAKGYGRLAARMRKGSVIRSQRMNGAATTRHPTEKPVDILRQLIESSSCLGEMVLDPCMGVGSSLVAARIEGRNAIGIEIDESYCEIAAKRLDAFASQVGESER